MRFTTVAAALVALSACSPSIPDSAAGVGFNNYAEYEAQQAARDAALAGSSPVPPAGSLSGETTTTPQATSAPLSSTSLLSTTPSTGTAASDVAADTAAALSASRSNSGQVPLQADPNNPAPQTVTSPTGISTENDFSAVDGARSIEADAELLARNRQQYQVVQPTALPTRNSNTGPNIVQYALSTSHPVGTKVYNRLGINKQARFQKNCAKYASADRAQEDFLERGGPQRDRLGLDPDGDGYACAWNPSPFRSAVNG